MYFQDLQAAEFPGFYNQENDPIASTSRVGAHVLSNNQYRNAAASHRSYSDRRGILPPYLQSIPARLETPVREPLFFMSSSIGEPAITPGTPILRPLDNSVHNMLPANYDSVNQQQIMLHMAGFVWDTTPGQFVYVPYVQGDQQSMVPAAATNRMAVPITNNMFIASNLNSHNMHNGGHISAPRCLHSQNQQHMHIVDNQNLHFNILNPSIDLGNLTPGAGVHLQVPNQTIEQTVESVSLSDNNWQASYAIVTNFADQLLRNMNIRLPRSTDSPARQQVHHNRLQGSGNSEEYYVSSIVDSGSGLTDYNAIDSEGGRTQNPEGDTEMSDRVDQSGERSQNADVAGSRHLEAADEALYTVPHSTELTRYLINQMRYLLPSNFSELGYILDDERFRTQELEIDRRRPTTVDYLLGSVDTDSVSGETSMGNNISIHTNVNEGLSSGEENKLNIINTERNVNSTDAVKCTSSKRRRHPAGNPESSPSKTIKIIPKHDHTDLSFDNMTITLTEDYGRTVTVVTHPTHSKTKNTDCSSRLHSEISPVAGTSRDSDPVPHLLSKDDFVVDKSRNDFENEKNMKLNSVLPNNIGNQKKSSVEIIENLENQIDSCVELAETVGIRDFTFSDPVSVGELISSSEESAIHMEDATNLQQNPSQYDGLSDRAWRNTILFDSHIFEPIESTGRQNSSSLPRRMTSSMMRDLYRLVSTMPDESNPFAASSSRVTPDTNLTRMQEELFRLSEFNEVHAQDSPSVSSFSSTETHATSNFSSNPENSVVETRGPLGRYFQNLMYQFYLETFMWMYTNVATNPAHVNTWTLIHLIGRSLEQNPTAVLVELLVGFLEGSMTSMLSQMNVIDLVLEVIELRRQVSPELISMVCNLSMLLYVALDPWNFLRRFAQIVLQAAQNVNLQQEQIRSAPAQAGTSTHCHGQLRRSALQQVELETINHQHEQPGTSTHRHGQLLHSALQKVQLEASNHQHNQPGTSALDQSGTIIGHQGEPGTSAVGQRAATTAHTTTRYTCFKLLGMEGHVYSIHQGSV